MYMYYIHYLHYVFSLYERAKVTNFKELNEVNMYIFTV